MLMGVLVLAVLGQSPELVRLDNGMRWLLVPRADGGRAAGVVTVAAGGADERPGIRGAAHLLEHLAFSGTPIVGSVRGWRVEAPVMERVLNLLDERQGLALAAPSDPRVLSIETELVRAEETWREKGDRDAFRSLLAEHFVTINANTTKDRTVYKGDFPREQLGLWLAAEAQRFAAPVFREFRAERGVVLQELKDISSDSNRLLEGLWRFSLEGSGYAWPTIGTEDDLRLMSPRALDAFYDDHYSAANAVGVLVGEFDVEEARAVLQQTFGQLEPRPILERAPIAFTAPGHHRLPGVGALTAIAFERPSAFDERAPVWEVVEALLAAPTGPLTELMKEGVITSAKTVTGPGVAVRQLHTLVVWRAREADPAAVERTIFEKLAAFRPTQAQVVSARVALEREWRVQLRSRGALAETLGESLLFTGDWKRVADPRHGAVTLEEVLEVLQGLTPARDWVVEGSVP